MTFKHVLSVGVLSLFCSLLFSCGKSGPPKDLVINSLSAVIPAQYQIKSGEVEYAPTSETAGTAKVKLEISPKEDLYEPSQRDAEIHAAASRDFDVQKNSVEKAQSDDIGIPDARMAEIDRRIAEHNRLIKKADQPWYKVAAKAGNSFTVYGTVDAVYEFKTWRFKRPRLEQKIADRGEPKSALGNDPNIVGSAEAKALLKEFNEANTALAKALTDASADLDRLAAQKKKNTEENLRARLSAILQATKAGTAYTTSYNIYNTARTLRVQFTKSDMSTRAVEADFSIVEDSKYHRRFNGQIVLSKDGNSPDTIQMTSATPGLPSRGMSDPILFEAGLCKPQLTLQDGDTLRCVANSVAGSMFGKNDLMLHRVQR